jgi:L-amino acid N-acyltransferase YncA
MMPLFSGSRRCVYVGVVEQSIYVDPACRGADVAQLSTERLWPKRDVPSSACMVE